MAFRRTGHDLHARGRVRGGPERSLRAISRPGLDLPGCPFGSPDCRRRHAAEQRRRQRAVQAPVELGSRRFLEAGPNPPDPEVRVPGFGRTRCRSASRAASRRMLCWRSAMRSPVRDLPVLGRHRRGDRLHRARSDPPSLRSDRRAGAGFLGRRRALAARPAFPCAGRRPVLSGLQLDKPVGSVCVLAICRASKRLIQCRRIRIIVGLPSKPWGRRRCSWAGRWSQAAELVAAGR